MATRRRKTAQFSSPACALHEVDESLPDDPEYDVCIKRIYDKPMRADGYRVLIDRLWPRGVTKEAAALDAWERDLAPSPALRKWFAHEPAHFADFRWKYRIELIDRAPLVRALRERAAQRRVTLLYAARDPTVNHAVILAEVIRES